MGKFKKRVLDYVCNKPNDAFRLDNGENGFSLKQVVKRFRGHHRWNVVIYDTYLLFQDRAIIQRRDEDKRTMLIYLIQEFLVHPKNIYEIRNAQKRMNHALSLLPHVYPRNDIAQYARKFFHYVDWLDNDFQLMTNPHEKLIDIPNMEISEHGDILSIKTSFSYNVYQCIAGFKLKIRIVDNLDVEKGSLYYGIPIEQRPLSLRARFQHANFVSNLFQHALSHNSTKEVEREVRNGFDIFGALKRQDLTLERCAVSWVPNEKKRRRFIKYVKKFNE